MWLNFYYGICGYLLSPTGCITKRLGGRAEVVNLVVGGMGLDVVMYTKHWKDVICAVNIFSPDMILDKNTRHVLKVHSCVLASIWYAGSWVHHGSRRWISRCYTGSQLSSQLDWKIANFVNDVKFQLPSVGWGNPVKVQTRQEAYPSLFRPS